MAELSITFADVSMTFGRTVMAEVSTAHGRCVIWPNRLSTVSMICFNQVKNGCSIGSIQVGKLI